MAAEEKGHGFAGERRVMASAAELQVAARQQGVLRGLAACGAGYIPRAVGHLQRRLQGCEETIVIYCVKGGGWAEVAGTMHPVRAGDVIVLPGRVPHAYGAQNCDPWTVHWFHASGSHIGLFLEKLGVSESAPVVWLGENIQVAALFKEMLECLELGSPSAGVFHASQVMAHLLSVLIRQRRQRPSVADRIQRVAHSINYLNEHLDRPLRVGALAELANLSAAHFATVFREVMGASPRDYLRLLRMHRASLLLSETDLTIKEIANRVGYPDPFHFSRAFKAFSYASPREYRSGGRSRPRVASRSGTAIRPARRSSGSANSLP